MKRLDAINNVTRCFSLHKPSHKPTDVLMIQLLGRRELHVSMQHDLWQLIWGLCLDLRLYIYIYIYTVYMYLYTMWPRKNLAQMNLPCKIWNKHGKTRSHNLKFLSSDPFWLTKWMFLIDMFWCHLHGMEDHHLLHCGSCLLRRGESSAGEVGMSRLVGWIV